MTAALVQMPIEIALAPTMSIAFENYPPTGASYAKPSAATKWTATTMAKDELDAMGDAARQMHRSAEC